MRYQNKPPSEPRISQKSPVDLIVPEVKGQYWAKWQICEDGTEDEEYWIATRVWEVVSVEPSFNEDGSFCAFVQGYAKSQSLENFIWAKPIKPLEPPK